MKAIYQGKEKEVWIISQEVEKPAWVKYGFESNLIMWTSRARKELRVMFGVLMTNRVIKDYIRPSQAIRNFVEGGLGNAFVAYETMFGKLGDVINLTDGIIVSAKNFSQTYKIINNSGSAVMNLMQEIKSSSTFSARQSKYLSILQSLLEENLNIYERRPIFLAFNSIAAGESFGNVMRVLAADIENLKTAQGGILDSKIEQLLFSIKADYEY